MDLSRRDLLKGAVAAAALPGAAEVTPGAKEPSLRAPLAAPLDFPRKSDFDIAPGHTYINGAYTHPMPKVAAAAYHGVVSRRGSLGYPAPAPPRPTAKEAFAALINAKPTEVSFVPNTSTGENLVVECLGIARNEGNVVTDSLHFEGALVHLMELKKRGLDLRVVKAKEGCVLLEDMARVIDNKTKLVEVSLVSMYNGFEHDLKAVCDLAHAHGAYVFADIIQGVGAVPFDVRACGVDFASTATYKWLMGDFGLGFMYVREELLGRVIQRPHWSYMSANDTDIHLSPFDPRNADIVTWTPGDDASQYFELGTVASAVRESLAVSIPYIQQLGVANIQAHRQPLLKKLQDELPRLGYVPQTPRESTSPIVTFAHKDAERINKRLGDANVNVRVAEYWMRISPSVYNDMADIERLLEALA